MSLRRIIAISLAAAIALDAATAAAIGRPEVYPREGQTEEQKMKDYDECRALAVAATGIDPDILEVKIRANESMLGRTEMPGPTGSLTLTPSQINQSSRYNDEIRELERQYDVYLDAFSKAMEERGYEVKR